MKYCPNTLCPSLSNEGFAPEYGNSLDVCPVCRVTLARVDLDIVTPRKQPITLLNIGRIADRSSTATAPYPTHQYMAYLQRQATLVCPYLPLQAGKLARLQS